MPPTIREQQVALRSRSVIDVVSEVLDEAYRLGASDIHLDPVADGLRTRFRVDGLLTEQPLLPFELRSELISRIKVLSGLRTDEHFAAQDGRFRYVAPDNSKYADIRVSIAPTYYGENAVLRILADHAQESTLDTLGFSTYDKERILGAIGKPDGMILVTGPTGSGKTTTLYALLRMLHASDVSIVTIEDPIEYAMTGIRQVQTQSRTGLTFSQGLRALLRQDPDIIMVGEIRDGETARVAANTALTGHLLLSTLHTNNAVTALPRLFDLGIEPYLIASTLRFVVAQRLIRGLCAECRGEKCAWCMHTGYQGRVVISETLAISSELREAIAQHAPSEEIDRLARLSGMRSMLDDGLEKAQQGITTLAEVLSAV